MLTRIRQWAARRALERKVESTSREIARFFGCPPLDFELEIKPPESEKGTVDVTTIDDLKTRVIFGIDIAGTFRMEGERNIIAIHSETDLEDYIRHEEAHGYHHRYNPSLRALDQKIEKDKAAFDLCCLSSTNGQLTPLSQEILASLYQSLLRKTVVIEAVANGYAFLKSNRTRRLNYNLTTEQGNEFGIDSLTDYHLNPKAFNFDTSSKALDFLTVKLKMAYGFLGAFTNLALFIDENREPTITVTTGDNSVFDSGKETRIDITYPPLPPAEVEKRLRELFYADVNTLTEELLKKNEQHAQRFVKAVQ